MDLRLLNLYGAFMTPRQSTQLQAWMQQTLTCALQIFKGIKDGPVSEDGERPAARNLAAEHEGAIVAATELEEVGEATDKDAAEEMDLLMSFFGKKQT